jgi:hypothetical protein
MKLFGDRSPVMKIVDTFVAGSCSSGTCEWVLAISDSKLYIAMQMGTIRRPLDRIDPSTWTDSERRLAPVCVKLAKLYPKSDSSYHRFRRRKGEEYSEVFQKYRDPLKAADHESLRDNFTAQTTDRETRTCELLRMHPCKDTAKYRGVQCKDVIKVGDGAHSVRLDTERVMKLVFKQYECDLRELTTAGIRIDVKYCLESVAAGLKHMHALELVHCDLKPANIFVEANHTNPSSQPYEFVVGDFDSAAVTGSMSELKLGDMHWIRLRHDGIVEEEDD